MIHVENVIVTPSVLPLTVGSRFLRAYVGVSPHDADCPCVTWTSSNEAVATVHPETGYIHAISAGKAVITACACENNGVHSTMTVTVTQPAEGTTPIRKLNLNTSSLTVLKGETATLSYTYLPENATNTSVRWYSSNRSIVSVNQEGTVTARGFGKVRIMAVAQDGSGASAYCDVTVTSNYYHIINKATGKVVNIYGSNITELAERKNVTLYTPTGSNEQIWRIDTISQQEDCYVKSYVNEAFGFNVDRRQSNKYNCDVLPTTGNETDAAVHFIPKANGHYMIALANYAGYYLTATGTADGSDIRWQEDKNDDSQLWLLEPVEVEKDEPDIEEGAEYHVVSQYGNRNALRVGTTNIFELSGDKLVRVERLSYWRRQKWTVTGTGDQKKLHTQLNNSYVLCNNGQDTDNGENGANVSENISDVYSNLTIIKYGLSENLYEIKLTDSGLYLTNIDDYTVRWLEYDPVNHAKQLWEFVKQPDNIHTGCDTSKMLTGTVVESIARDGNKFVVRYYKLAGKIQNFEPSTLLEGALDNTIDTLKAMGYDLDAADYYPYVEDIISNGFYKYYSSPNSDNLRPSELDILHDYKISVVSVYQNYGKIAKSFNEKNAQLDAFCALLSAMSLGQPEGTAIYFAVDYDASDDLNIIQKYFETIKNKLSGRYKIGVYGVGKVCKTIKQDLGYADYSWLGHSTGNPETDLYKEYEEYDNINKYNIKQAESIQYNDVNFDHDTAVGNDYGQWTP